MQLFKTFFLCWSRIWFDKTTRLTSYIYCSYYSFIWIISRLCLSVIILISHKYQYCIKLLFMFHTKSDITIKLHKLCFSWLKCVNLCFLIMQWNMSYFELLKHMILGDENISNIFIEVKSFFLVLERKIILKKSS